MEELSRCQMNGEMTDVTFVVGDKRFHAHKLVLGIKCKYFKSLFYGSMKVTKDVIEHDDCDSTTFSNFLDYVYERIMHDSTDFSCSWRELVNLYKYLDFTCTEHIYNTMFIDKRVPIEDFKEYLSTILDMNVDRHEIQMAARYITKYVDLSEFPEWVRETLFTSEYFCPHPDEREKFGKLDYSDWNLYIEITAVEGSKVTCTILNTNSSVTMKTNGSVKVGDVIIPDKVYQFGYGTITANEFSFY